MIKNTDKYRLLFETLPDAFAYHRIVTDDEGAPVDYVFLEVNAAYEEMIGLKRSLLIGRRASEVLPVPEKDEIDWISLYGQVALSGEPVRFESYSEPLGHWHDVYAFSEEQGCFAVTFREVTVQKSETIALEALAELAQEHLKSPAGNINYQALVDGLLKLSYAKFAAINTYESGGTKTVTRAIAGIEKNIRKASEMIGFELVGRAWDIIPERMNSIKEGRLLRFQNLYDASAGSIPKPMAILLEKTFATGEIFIAEIAHESKTIGDLIIFMPWGKSLHHPYIIDLCAAQAGNMLIRKQAEQALLESEERYRDLVDNAGDLVQCVDSAGKFIFVNRYWLSALDYSREELENLNLWDIIHPDSLEHCMAAFQEVLSGKAFGDIEAVFVTKQGEQIIVEGNVNVKLDDEGNFEHTRGIYRDVTERRKAEEALRESEEKHRFLAENMGDIIWTLDLDFKTTFVSPSIAKILGYTPEERKLQTLSEVMTPESQVRSMEMLKQELAREEEGTYDPERTATIEVEYYHRDGSTVWMENIMRALRDDEGRLVGIYGVSRDIVERKQAEEALQQEKAFQAILLDLAADFINVPLAEFDRAINDLLKKIGEFTGLDRIYLFRHDYRRRVTTNTHEWCGEGITPEIDNLQETPFDLFLDFLKTWEKGEIVHIPSVAQMPEEHPMRAILAQQGIQSLVLIPLMQNQVNTGFVGFDAVNECKYFSEQEIALLRVLAEIIANAFANKEAEEELARAKKQTDQFFNQSLHGFFFCMLDEAIAWNDESADKDKLLEYSLDHQRMTRVNQAMLDQYGASEEDFIGITMRELFQHDLDHAREIWRGLFDRGNWHVETFEQKMDGTPIIIDGDYICLYDDQGRITGHFGVQVDVTEQKLSAEKLVVAEQNQRILLDNIQTQVWYLTDEHTYGAVNEAHAAFNGVKKEDLSFKNMYDIFPADVVEVCREANREVFTMGRPVLTEEWVPHVSGEQRLISILKSPKLRVDGTVEYVVCSAEDITDRKKAEEEILTLNEELEQRVKERTINLEALNKELASFAYSISHDFRAPLRALNAFSASLTEKHSDQLDEQGLHYLKRIRYNSQYMSDLIDDLLKLSRITRTEVNPQEVDLSRLAEEQIQLLRETEPQRRVAAKIAPGLTARGDRALLRAALENLLENAWKFSANEAQAEIEMGRTTIDGEEVFFVRDNGVGFNMAYADKLFGAFQRLHAVDEFPGTGIGLATVQRVLNRHGGRIWAESEEGKGATFYFTLPL